MRESFKSKAEQMPPDWHLDEDLEERLFAGVSQKDIEIADKLRGASETLSAEIRGGRAPKSILEKELERLSVQYRVPLDEVRHKLKLAENYAEAYAHMQVLQHFPEVASSEETSFGIEATINAIKAKLEDFVKEIGEIKGDTLVGDVTILAAHLRPEFAGIERRWNRYQEEFNKMGFKIGETIKLSVKESSYWHQQGLNGRDVEVEGFDPISGIVDCRFEEHLLGVHLDDFVSRA